jgi:nitrogen fixation protein
MYYWERKFLGIVRGKKKRADQETGFVPVVVKNKGSSEGTVLIRLTNGVEIILNHLPEASWVMSLSKSEFPR